MERGLARCSGADAPKCLTAAVLMAPFVVIYGCLFVYPTIKMAQLSFTNAPLIGPGNWVGLDNYFGARLRPAVFDRGLEHDLLRPPLGHPGHRCSRLWIALGVNRLKGWLQSLVLAAFFLPYVLPVSVVYPDLELDVRQGFRRRAIRHRAL